MMRRNDESFYWQGPHKRHRRVVVALLFCGFIAPACEDSQTDPEWAAERAAITFPSHPYAGFWKEPGCADDFGLAISPAGPGMYSVSFCGPGGCFWPGTYRPDTSLVGDPNYRILDNDTIETRLIDGQTFSKSVRCPKR